MFKSIWTYPWDLADCGIDNVLDELAMIGINDISFTTSYHAGRFLQVRSPIRKSYFPEDGVLYYPATLERFNNLRVKPRISKFQNENKDFTSTLIQKTQDRGMTISGWTVCLHNTRLGYEHPEICVHNAFGDTIFYNQCPSNDDVREYIIALIEDIDVSLPLKSIQLESMNFMGFAHEYHHEKDGICLSAYEDFLFSLCFCESCMTKGENAGIDMHYVRLWVKEQITKNINGNRLLASKIDLLQDGMSLFSEFPKITEFLHWRSNMVSTLVKDVKSKVQNSDLYFLSLLTNRDSWLYGVNLQELSQYCDGIVICSYDCNSKSARDDIRTSRAEFQPKTKIITGMRAFYPEYHDEHMFVEKVQNVLKESKDGFIFYNYGLIPKTQLDWVRKAIEVCNQC